MMTWAEDRATVGTDPSADPGAKTEGRAENRLVGSARSFPLLRDWHQSAKSLAAVAASLRASEWPEFPEKCGQIFRNAHRKARKSRICFRRSRKTRGSMVPRRRGSPSLRTRIRSDSIRELATSIRLPDSGCGPVGLRGGAGPLTGSSVSIPRCFATHA